MSNVQTMKVAKELVKISAVNGMTALPDSVCEGNGQYLISGDVPTMVKQAVTVSLNLKKLNPKTNEFDRFSAKDITAEELSDMMENRDNWRVGFNVRFTKDRITTYIGAGDAKDQGFTTSPKNGANIWSVSELGFEASGNPKVNGKFIA